MDTTNERHQRLLAVVAAGIAIRLATFYLFPEALAIAESRPELSTPVTSWKSLQEGIYLFRRGYDPYDGSMFRQSPLLLGFFSLCPSILTPLVFTLADVGTALCVIGTAGTKRASDLQGATRAIQHEWVAAIALLNPLAIGGTLARSSTTFSNLAIALSAYGAAAGSSLLCITALSIALHLSLPLVLVPPILLLLAHNAETPLRKTFEQAMAALIAHQITLLVACYLLLGQSWSFLRSYSAILTVYDLTPNIGLHWYFFIEMFDHFRKFYLLVFQAHLLCYAIPVCLKLRYDPLLALTVLVGISATFKSYPSAGDTAMYHTLLTLFPELVLHLRHPLFTIMAHLYTVLLLPAFHYVWLYAGSGNSNFYYASTLVWALASGLGVLDTLTAGLKRRFLLEEEAKGHEALQKGVENVDNEAWTIVQS